MVYLGTFLIAFAVLALEVTLTRLLSAATWYYLAFFAIATAMLGMTAGATRVYLEPRRYAADRLNEALARACLGFALVVPVALILLCMIPLVPVEQSVMTLFALLTATAVCSFPYYFAGIAVSALLTQCPLPIGKLYASDLLGASAGCLFVLGCLEVLDAPSLILLCAAVGALAASVFAWRLGSARRRRASLAACLALVILAIGNASSARFIRPLCVKGRIEPATRYIKEKWNSFSRITVNPPRYGKPDLWAPNPLAPDAPVKYYPMAIDGEAGTLVGRFRSPADIEHLRYDVTNVAYALRPTGGACIIGVGGGRDVQSALLFGQEHATGVEINPIFVDLLRREFKDFAGLAGRKDVTLVVDEARSYLSRVRDRFAVIQMSLIDTWAATGAGAFSLSENSLYTVEAWTVFLGRLSENGLFTVSRWYDPRNLGETGRLVSLAVASALRSGATEPAQHIALVTRGEVATLLLSKRPLASDDIARLEQFCGQMHFDAIVIPGERPKHPLLSRITSARSLADLELVARDTPLRCDPPTDENPYFFNMLRLSHLSLAFDGVGGVIEGNLLATLTLLGLIVALLVLALATIVIPLFLRRKLGEAGTPPDPVLWSGALYFSLIGAGFMFVEMALIQRLTVLLSHPVYALGIILFTIILSTGVGSFLSERLPLTRAPWVFAYPLAAAIAILLARLAFGSFLSLLMTSPIPLRIAAAVAFTFPMGMILGLFFPTGMRLVRQVCPTQTPWYWALNGVFGVLCSALAVLVAISWGVSTNFYIAAGAYAAVGLCAWRLHGKARRQPVTA